MAIPDSCQACRWRTCRTALRDIFTGEMAAEKLRIPLGAGWANFERDKAVADGESSHVADIVIASAHLCIWWLFHPRTPERMWRNKQQMDDLGFFLCQAIVAGRRYSHLDHLARSPG